ncbi:hypothetical protein F2Q69_00001846 [Brassica cretica]|uniref:Uncharacterized protein n=1 Tax=Brassica cretica TaxID=69181 RepID=A0A8S9P432_BRACR|nr:hypothetical protein F2Q69_00001846 [Brassica cretica]
MKPPVRACHLAVAEGFSFSLLLFLLFSYSSFTSFLLCGFPGDLAFTAKDRGWNRVFGFRSLVQLRGWSGRSRIRVRSWGFVGDSDFQLFYLLREAAARGSGGTASSSCLPCGDLDLLFLGLRAKWLRFLVGDATLGSRCAIASSQSSGELQRSVEIGRVVAWTGRLWPAQ